MELTIELLKFLQDEGVTCIIRKYGNDHYEPAKGDMDAIRAGLAVTPLQEDSYYAIEDAIAYFDSEELYNQTIQIPESGDVYPWR